MFTFTNLLMILTVLVDGSDLKIEVL